MKHIEFLLAIVSLFSGLIALVLLLLERSRSKDRHKNIEFLFWGVFSILLLKNVAESYILVSAIPEQGSSFLIPLLGNLLKLTIILLFSAVFYRNKITQLQSPTFLFTVLPLLVAAVVLFVLRERIHLKNLNAYMDGAMLMVFLIGSSYTLFNKNKSLTPPGNPIVLLPFSIVALLSLGKHYLGWNLPVIFNVQYAFFTYYFLSSLLLSLRAIKSINKKPSPLDPKNISPKTFRKYSISKREIEVINYLLEGDSRVSISEKLYISPKTVDNHISRIFRKFHVNNKIALISKILSEEQD